MHEFFTVDRRGELQPGDTVDLVVHQDLGPPELQGHIDQMFPDGVSEHGNGYFLSSTSHATVASPAIEILFEYVRRSHFPVAPSRFQCMYGVSSLDEARQFRLEHCADSGRILKVRAKSLHRGNMRLLTNQATTLVQSWFAHLYWEGAPGPNDTFWECLLVPPVEVLEVVVEP
jgi:hypothetical protein